jgi:hypothetical protein
MGVVVGVTTCPQCGNEMCGSIQCGHCCGEGGYHDCGDDICGGEDCPLAGTSDDWFICPECNGKGGWVACPLCNPDAG